MNEKDQQIWLMPNFMGRSPGVEPGTVRLLLEWPHSIGFILLMSIGLRSG